MSKYLSASDILKQQQKKQTKRQEAFDFILEQCYKKIQKCIQVTRNVFECFFEIPEFLIGYPLYDLNECTSYCHALLTSKGFQVQYIFPRVLFISWKPPVKTHTALPMPCVGSVAAPAGPTAPAARPKKFVQKPRKIVLDLS